MSKRLNANVEKAKVVGRRILARVPEPAVQGFHRGRTAGHEFVKNVPYGAGATVGFCYGASEAVVDLLATPLTALCNWVGWAVGCESQRAEVASVESDLA